MGEAELPAAPRKSAIKKEKESPKESLNIPKPDLTIESSITRSSKRGSSRTASSRPGNTRYKSVDFSTKPPEVYDNYPRVSPKKSEGKNDDSPTVVAKLTNGKYRVKKRKSSKDTSESKNMMSARDTKSDEKRQYTDEPPSRENSDAKVSKDSNELKEGSEEKVSEESAPDEAAADKRQE